MKGIVHGYRYAGIDRYTGIGTQVIGHTIEGTICFGIS